MIFSASLTQHQQGINYNIDLLYRENIDSKQLSINTKCDRSQYSKFSSEILPSPQTAKNTDDTNHQPTTPGLLT